MRVLRRISGHVNYGKSDKTDYDVRALLGAPSIDCLSTRARLSYARRVAVTGPRPLHALLQARPGGAPLEWTASLLEDMRWMQVHIPELGHLGDPAEFPGVWHSLMVSDKEQWNTLVRKVLFLASVCVTRNRFRVMM